MNLIDDPSPVFLMIRSLVFVPLFDPSNVTLSALSRHIKAESFAPDITAVTAGAGFITNDDQSFEFNALSPVSVRASLLTVITILFPV